MILIVIVMMVMVRQVNHINDGNNKIDVWSHQVEELIILLVRNIQCLLKKESYIRIGKLLSCNFEVNGKLGEWHPCFSFKNIRS